VLSTPPSAEQITKEKNADWFGSPAIALPKRQESKFFSPNLTTSPSSLRFAARAIVELIRIIIPETVVICLSILLIAYGHDLLVDEPWWKFIFLFPLYYLGLFGLPAFLVCVLLKWILVGRYKPKQFPIWSLNVWLSEAITVFYEALSVPFLLAFLKGTAWLPFLLKFLGVKTGNRVWMDTTDITEYDMVSIGSDAALNYDCGPQTHLFEDRVMKIGSVDIGSRSSIGAKSIILYDSEVEADVQIEPLSLVMKGEKLPAGTIWTGSPVRPS
jgi:non-ribosomal peptide synthetase-like protein